MTHSPSFAKLVFVLAFFATIIGFTAFGQNTRENTFKNDQQQKDSLKTNKRLEITGKNDYLDVELKQLDVQMNYLNEEMKNIDFSKAQQQLEKAMQEVNSKKITAEINESLKSIDWNAINKQIDESAKQISKIDMTAIKNEIEKAKVHLEKQKEEMRLALGSIDLKEVKTNTENALKKAKRSLEEAREDITNQKDFTNALENDGLLNKDKPYKIEVKNGELYLNDKKQSKEISKKYQKFYRKNNFTIEVNKDRE